MPHPPFTGDYAAILKKYWGHDTFRPLQLETIESVAAGRDTLVLYRRLRPKEYASLSRRSFR